MIGGAAGRGLALLLDKDRVEAAIWRNHITSPSTDTRIALFNYYRPLARRLALIELNRVGGRSLERADFEQLAMEGLLQAIDRFDVSRGTRFGAYAALRIRGCMRNELAKASEANAQFNYRKRIERDRLRSLRDSADPTADPLAAVASLTVKIALGTLLEETTDIDPDELASGDASAYDNLAWQELLSELDARLHQLPKNEAWVLEQHYRNGVAFKEIAQLLGLSQGRVSQLHAQGLERLRRQLRNQQ